MQRAPSWNVSLQVAVPLQVRVIHELLLQVIAVPVQTAAKQTSSEVHGSLSSQPEVLGTFTQVFTAQASLVHTLPSSQSASSMHPTQRPPEQVPEPPPANTQSVPSGS